MTDQPEELIAFWDGVAGDWDTQVGSDGDSNRRLNSDPVLWEMAGDVSGKDVLDAGCGTGYLTLKLFKSGARVTGVDFSEKMISIARKKAPAIDFRVDSCSELFTVSDCSFDLLISNYVLMDLPDLEGAVRSFYRVLRPSGTAVVVFSHPCFPQADAVKSEDRRTVSYNWPYPYFEERKRVDPPWGHFTSEFIRFHRPLSWYWKAFSSAGFTVLDFDEPVITKDRFPEAQSRKRLNNNLSRPYSVAFKLSKREMES